MGGKEEEEGLGPEGFAVEDIPGAEALDPENRSSTVQSSTPSGKPSASATPTSDSSRPPGRRGPASKARRGGKTVLTGHMPPPMPKHVKERIQRYMDDRYFDPSMPPRYRARYRGDEKD